MTDLLYGIHDRQGAHILPPGGWCVDTVALSDNPAPTDYASLRGDINWIVRVNWGYGSTGTIPLPENDRLFMDRLAHYVHNSKGARIWIIGNEPNHEQERPNGVFITPARYADFFVRARTLIKTINSNHRVIPAPCAPYHANPMNWMDYLEEMMGLIAANGGCDGVAVHAYTRSSNPEDITSPAFMEPPLEDAFSGFYTYQDALDCLPGTLDGLPVYITEFNELLEGGWHDANTGVVQAAYGAVNDHNLNPLYNRQPIHCLILYRWPKFDKWHIKGKQGVIEDFKAAIGRGYTSPVGVTNVPETNHLPFTPNQSTPTQPTPDLPPREWDERLTARGVTVKTPQIEPGQQYWRVAKARWYDEQESQGRHHIYIETQDPSGAHQAGVPFLAKGQGSQTPGNTNGKVGFDAANVPMWASEGKNGYSVFVVSILPTEKLVGVGMGADAPDGFNAGIHTSAGVTFQLTTMPQAQPQPPTEQPQPASAIGYVTAPLGLRLRDMPSTLGNQLALVPYGEQVRIVAVANQEGWVRARYGDKEGWMASQYISLQPPEKQPTEPTPEPLTPGNERDNWTRCIAFVRKWEGGWADDPNDVGGATNKGITLATFTRWRAIQGQPEPTKDDLRSLSDAEANRIYYELYWKGSGSDKLSWPLCLANFDTAVNAGEGRAREMLERSNGVFLAYMAHLIDWYTRIDNFEHFGRAWIRRRAEILLEASK